MKRSAGRWSAGREGPVGLSLTRVVIRASLIRPTGASSLVVMPCTAVYSDLTFEYQVPHAVAQLDAAVLELGERAIVRLGRIAFGRVAQ